MAWNPRPAISALALLLGAACQEAPRVEPGIRLTPATVSAEGLAPGALVDRDAASAASLARATTVRFHFDHDVEVVLAKVHGASLAMAAEDGGTTAGSEAGWRTVRLASSVRGRDIEVTLTPAGVGARVSEIELWGQGLPLAPRSAEALAAASREPGARFENALVARGSPAAGLLASPTVTAGERCLRSLVPVVAPRSARRAWLVYEANVARAVSLSRSLDGESPVGGFWVGPGERRTVVDELDPERLAEQASVVLCQPPGAVGDVRVDDVRIVLALDDGTLPLDRDAQARAASLPGGGGDWSRAVSDVELALDRPMQVEALGIESRGAPVSRVALRDGGAWSEVMLPAGPPAALAVVEPQRAADAVKLTTTAATPELTGLAASASALGARLAQPRLVVTYPALTWRGGRWAGERFGDRAFVQGWAESPAGRGLVEVDGVPVGVDGTFATPLERPADGQGTWRVTLRARFPDGSKVERTIDLDEDQAAAKAIGALGSSAAFGATPDAAYGVENATAWGDVDPARGGKVTLGTEVTLDAPASAVAALTKVGITRKGREMVPPLDAGMINVTAPAHGAYRFLPKGQKFAKAVKVTIPYDPALLPEGMTPQDVNTYYFDEAQGRWQPLTRAEVKLGPDLVVSETDHFTFMINAVLVLPDHPGPASFNPNSIKDLKAADPSAAIDLVAPPEPNNQGSAQTSLPIRLPPARGAHHPALRLGYDSQASNGWLGVGWDVAVSSVQVETRFGANIGDGEPRYLLDGEQLVPKAQADPELCVDGVTLGRRYLARVERSFLHVLQCNGAGASSWFEVTDTSGTLFVYGKRSRLTAATGDRVGQWFLDRAVDANGNLCEYGYDADGLAGAPGHGEPFRQLYLRTVRYSGRANRTGPGALTGVLESGRYLVELRNEAVPRPDVLSSGRFGFKVVTRFRLAAVLVQLDRGEPGAPSLETIREYRLGYESGAFGKSNLKSIEVLGAGADGARRSFTTHSFEYTGAQVGNAFGSPREWTQSPGADDRPITQSRESGAGVHGYVGIGPSPSKASGSVGGRVGANWGRGSTRAMLIDVNGDGLPDRLVETGQGVLARFGQPGGEFSAALPPGDPGAGSSVSSLGVPGIGKDRSSGYNAAFQVVGFGASLNVGVSAFSSEASQYLLDFDGDGRVDVVNGGQVLFNQPRPPGQAAFSFLSQAGVGSPEPPPPDSDYPELEQQLRLNDLPSKPASALLEWEAPFDGIVDVAGTIGFARAPPAQLDPRWDGVRLSVFVASPPYPSPPDLPIFEVDKRLSDAAPSSTDLGGLRVRSGTKLFFLLSTLKNVAIDLAGPTPLEQVSFAPVVTYRAPIAASPAQREPSGASTFVFDAAGDFRLAGDPKGALVVPVSGTLRVTSTLEKRPATDEVRTCIQRFAPDSTAVDVTCGDTAPGVVTVSLRTFAPEEVTALQPEHVLDVVAGERLVFRVDSDLPVDPASLDWRVHGELTTICERPGRPCRSPGPDDAWARFSATPTVALHLPIDSARDPSTDLPRPRPEPLRPFVAPRSGTYTLLTSQPTVQQSMVTTPVFLAARTAERLLFKRALSDPPQSVQVTLTAGEEVFFEAHAEGQFLIDWMPTVEGPGLAPNTLDGTFVPEVNATFDAFASFDTTIGAYRLLRQVSILGGGHHGWRYGVWRSAEPFDPAKLVFRAADFPQGSDQAAIDQWASGDPRSQQSALVAPLLPRFDGTTREGRPGLVPDQAWVGADGTVVIGVGTMHAALEADAGDPAAAPTAVGQARRSAGRSVSVSGGFGPFSAAFSSGQSSQRADLIDFNGDRVVDLVSGDGSRQTVRLVGIHDLQPGRVLSADVAIRHNSDTTLSAGLGVSSPEFHLGAGSGTVKAVRGMFAGFGVGAGVNFATTGEELTDINGDGLPDAVRRGGGGCAGFSVRLNLGDAFGQPDCFPAPGWKSSDGPLDGLAGALGLSADQVRRTTAITIQSNAGFSTADESYAGGANWESSVAATAVSLLDITGDGLPDWVRKSPSDGTLHVMVNTGFGFAPEVDVAVPAWPRGVVTQPTLSDNGLFGGVFSGAARPVAEAVLGANGGLVDAVEASGGYSALPNVNFLFTYPIPLSPLFTPWLHVSVGGDATLRRVSGYQLGMMDLDGDGFADHVLKAERQDDGTSNESVWARPNQLAGANLLKTIRRPLGGSIELAYQRTGNTVAMPESRFVLQSSTVHDGRALAPGEPAAGHDLFARAEYQGGRYDRAEREFLGFTKVTVKSGPDPAAPMRTVERGYRNDAIAYKGLLLEERLYDEGGRLFTETVNVIGDPLTGAPKVLQAGEAGCDAGRPYLFLDEQHFCGSVFPALSATTRTSYEGQTAGVTTRQVFGYDDLGNVVTFDDLGDSSPAVTGDDVHAVVDYWLDDPAALQLHATGRPKTIAVKDAAGNLLRSRGASYDARGNLETLTSLVDQTTGETVVSNLQWDVDGNLHVLEGPATRSGRYTITYEYDLLTRTLPRQVTDSHGYVSTAEHDPRFGEATVTTDVNRNMTRRHFDDFGRLDQVFGPHDTTSPTVAVEYRHAEPIPWARTMNRAPGGATIDTVVLMDGLGRVIQTKKTSESTADGGPGDVTSVGWAATGRQAYDGLGRLVEQGQLFFQVGSAPGYDGRTAAYPTRFALDVLDRKTRIEEPVEPASNAAGSSVAVTAMEYGFGTLDGVQRFRAQVTDAEGKVRVMFRDPADRVMAVEERNAGQALLTRYRYDALGALTEVIDARGMGPKQTSIGYDLLGRRTSLDNPDAGLTTFKYDGAGNLTEKLTANLRAGGGRPIVYDYVFDQLRAIHYPNGADVTFGYGPPGAAENGSARVVQVTDDAGSEARGYGKLGETVRTTRTVRPLKPGDSAKVFETRFAFDSFGRMQTITYPDKETVTYGYDAGGLVKSAIGDRPATTKYAAARETYLAKATYDVFGQRRRLEVGNGAVSVHGYFPESRRLATLGTVAAGRTLQANSYVYDRVGNIQSLDNALPLSNGQRTGPVRFSYGYDDLHRLTSATGRAETRPGIADTFATTYRCDAIHNMTSNVQVHAVRTVLATGEQSDFPPKTNHAFDYVYGGAGPHQATKVGDRFLNYDLNGNTVRECRDHGDPTCQANADQLRRYYWSDDDRLDAVIDGGGQNVVQFVYDAGGDRVAKLGRGGEQLTIGQWFSLKGRKAATKHVFVGATRVASKLLPPPGWDAPVPETDPATIPGCTASDFQPRKCAVPPLIEPKVGKKLAGFTVKPATYYYHPDHLGSTSWVTDQSGKVHEHAEYFPYGEVWRDPRSDSESSPVQGQQFLFTGKELDEETGLYYFGARYYDPVRARWASADPALGGYLEGAGGFGGIYNGKNLGLYGYAQHNPVRLVDPDGESATVAGALIGGLISGGIAAWRGEDARHILGAAAQGAIAGAALGSIIDTGGASLGVMIAAGATGNAAGGIVGRAISGDAQTGTAVALDAATGAAGVMMGAVVAKAVPAVESGVRSALGRLRPGSPTGGLGKAISEGHAFAKHVIQKGEFKDLGITTRESFAKHIDRIVEAAKGANVRNLAGGRTAYWDDATRTVVIRNPNAPDMGTAFRPTSGRAYFEGLE